MPNPFLNWLPWDVGGKELLSTLHFHTNRRTGIQYSQLLTPDCCIVTLCFIHSHCLFHVLMINYNAKNVRLMFEKCHSKNSHPDLRFLKQNKTEQKTTRFPLAAHRIRWKNGDNWRAAACEHTYVRMFHFVYASRLKCLQWVHNVNACCTIEKFLDEFQCWANQKYLL